MSNQSNSTIKKRVLKNGVRLLTERIDSVRSVSIGLWLEVGSQDETPRQNGLAHCIEHMFFKGTPKRDVMQIATEINNLGGYVNAYTSQEVICLHAKVVDDKLQDGLDLLADILTHSEFSQAELERERNVILEEIRMYDDTPDEQVFDNFTNVIWKNNPLGRPILGVPNTVSKFKSKDINAFCKKHFTPNRLIVSVAGNFDQRKLNRLLDRYFSDFGKRAAKPKYKTPKAKYDQLQIKRPLEQTHFCIGTESIKKTSADRFGFALMNLILGGGMSSRIFQEVREKRGLAYSVGSHYRPYQDTGYFVVYGGTGKGLLNEVLDVVLGEVKKIYSEPVSDIELQSAKDAFKGSILLGLENTNTRMTRMAEQEMTFGSFVGVDEVIQKIEKVSVRDVQRIAKKYLKDKPVAISTIGPDQVKRKEIVF